MSQKDYDIIGIGIGPFNLGLAALCSGIPELNCLFIDQHDCFNWHPGMMLASARLQVPWYADLVSLASPCSKFIYMNFVHETKRQFRFGIGDPGYIKRSVYNDYCRWVADQLPSLRFNTACTAIEKENNIYRVHTSQGTFLTQRLILGTGTTPFMPAFTPINNDHIIHSSQYLFKKQEILSKKSITIVGSGQSAAEIFYDLLQSYNGQLSWFTKSKRFYPMDYSKLTLEMSTPDYIDYFFSLPERKKKAILAGQDSLYKGINQTLISDIYDLLDEKDSRNILISCNCELQQITGDIQLGFLHTEEEETFTHDTDALILATGYAPVVPECIQPLRPHIHLDHDGNYKAKRNYSVDENDSIFIQNGEQSTHGFNAADISLGPYRNAVILNSILGYERYAVETGITFQSFGLPKLQRT
jgi:lysine N6-hydroxylase